MCLNLSLKTKHYTHEELNKSQLNELMHDTLPWLVRLFLPATPLLLHSSLQVGCRGRGLEWVSKEISHVPVILSEGSLQKRTPSRSNGNLSRASSISVKGNKGTANKGQTATRVNELLLLRAEALCVFQCLTLPLGFVTYFRVAPINTLLVLFHELSHY